MRRSQISFVGALLAVSACYRPASAIWGIWGSEQVDDFDWLVQLRYYIEELVSSMPFWSFEALGFRYGHPQVTTAYCPLMLVIS